MSKFKQFTEGTGMEGAPAFFFLPSCSGLGTPRDVKGGDAVGSKLGVKGSDVAWLSQLSPSLLGTVLGDVSFLCP